MNGTVRCFIRIHGQYKEISYEELLKRKETDASYRDKRFIPLHGMLLEVPPEETTTLSTVTGAARSICGKRHSAQGVLL